MGTLACDMIGTFFSLERPRRALAELGAPDATLDLWFAQALRDSFAWSHAGGYAPLKEVLEAALPRTLSELGVDAGPEQLQGVISTFGELDLEEDAEEAVAMMTDAGWRLVALTNGSEALTRKLLERGNIADRFTALLSCDDIKITKPHPDVYAMARRHAEGELWMIAGHAWDIAGAHRAGLRTAWVSRHEGHYLQIYPQPDVVAGDLVEAARGILEAS